MKKILLTACILFSLLQAKTQNSADQSVFYYTATKRAYFFVNNKDIKEDWKDFDAAVVLDFPHKIIAVTNDTWQLYHWWKTVDNDDSANVRTSFYCKDKDSTDVMLTMMAHKLSNGGLQYVLAVYYPENRYMYQLEDTGDPKKKSN